MKSSSRTAFSACLLAVSLTGCFSTPSAPPPYGGEDMVGTVSADMFIGDWSGHMVNPPKGQEANGFTATFNGDGTTVYLIDDLQSGLNLKFEMTGTWAVEGDYIVTQLESMREVSGNALGGMMTSMMNGMRDQMGGKANVYEASSDRLILVGDGGEAHEFRRR